MNELVSIIIPTHNEEPDIRKCLDSLKSQTYSPTEVIVVDDGSTDRTRQIIKEYKLKILSQPHLGPGSARNLGVKHSKGKILVFVDADMTFEKNFIDKLTQPIRDGKAVGTFSLDEFVSNWENVWARCWNWNNGNPDRIRIRPNKHDQEDFRAILASEFIRVGGFDPIGYTDTRTLTKKLGVLPAASPGAVYYHKNPGSLTEIYRQARWIGRRRMRGGALGQTINLIRHIFPFSILIGLVVSLSHHEFRFLIFKTVYDFGFISGIITNLISHQTAR